MNTINVSFETIAKLSGIGVSELKSQLTKKGEDDKLELIDNQSLIDKTLETGHSKKLDSAIDSKKEDHKKEGRLEVYKKIEDDAAAHGIKDYQWNRDGVAKFKESFSKSDAKPAETADIKKHPDYPQLMKDHKEKINSLESDHKTEMKTLNEGVLKSTIRRKVRNLVTSDEHKLTKYDEGVTDNLVNLMVDKMYKDAQSKEITIKEVDGSLKLLDKQGKDWMDPQKDYDSPTFDAFALGHAKNGFFPEQSGKDITSGGPGTGSGGGGGAPSNTYKWTSADNTEQSLEIPKFDNETEFGDWTAKMMSSGNPQSGAIIEHAGKIFYENKN